MKTLVLLLAASTLVACSDGAPATDAATPEVGAPAASTPAPAPAEEPAPAPVPTEPGPDATPPPAGEPSAEEARYTGRWTGVEGMYLQVTPKAGGGVTLDMQWDLDNKGTFDGSVTAEGLRFMRNGVAETAVHTDGNATGLKYLAGKADCLTVKTGEGYCRD